MPLARPILSSLTAFCFLWAASGACAQTGLKLQLVPEVQAVKPGTPFYVGIFIQHERGYHTYWKFPGIVGVPTSVAWELPEGFSAGPLEYPEPETTMMFQIKAQGYERDVLLQTKITPPSNLKPGDTVRLNGKATWMCCGRTCHPGTMPLTLDLPVADTAAFHPQWHPLFEKERARYSHPSSAWQATAMEDAETVTLTLRASAAQARTFAPNAPSPAAYFYTEDGWINSDAPQQATVDAQGNLTLILRKSDVYMGKQPPTTLLGVVSREGGWLKAGQLHSLNVSPLLMRGSDAR